MFVVSGPGLLLRIEGGETDPQTPGLIVPAAGVMALDIQSDLVVGQLVEAWVRSAPRLVSAAMVMDPSQVSLALHFGTPLDGAGPIPAGVHTLQVSLPTARGTEIIEVIITVASTVPSRVRAGEGYSQGVVRHSLLTPTLLTAGLLLLLMTRGRRRDDDRPLLLMVVSR